MNLDSTLPLTEADLLAGAWQGVSQLGRGEVAIAHTFPCPDHAGFVHYGVKWLGDRCACWSKKPVHPRVVGFALDQLLRERQKAASDLQWDRCTISPEVLADRMQRREGDL